MVDELESEIDEIRRQCDSLSLSVVPGRFEQGNAPVVHWESPELSDWKPFLELARRLGVSVIILEQLEFDEDFLEDLRPEGIETGGNHEDEADEGALQYKAEWEAIRQKYETHYASTGAYMLHWMKEGICYSFERQTSWYLELTELVHELKEKVEAESVEAQQEEPPDLTVEEVEQIASELAQEELFQRATIRSTRLHAFRKRFPKLCQEHPGQVSEIIGQARGVFELEVKPELEKAVDQQIESLSKEGLSKEKIAKKLRITVSRVRKAL